MDILIQANNIFIEYNGQTILNIEQLEVYEYDRIGIIGANGSGKSTLLKFLTEQLAIPGSSHSSYGVISYLPQQEAIKPSTELDKKTLGFLGLTSLNSTCLSGGEETRLKIANAFSTQAHGIFPDEPTCHLDKNGIPDQ